MVNKKIFFLLVLPLSSNTMFASLMNQNPDIGVTANSITLEIILPKEIQNISATKIRKGEIKNEF